MKIIYRKQNKGWWVVDNDGWYITYEDTPKEARRKARLWHLYLTTVDEELAQKYLNGETEVK